MKLIVQEGCIVDFGDGKGGVHVEVGQEIDVNKDTAAILCQTTSRALYLSKEDDPTDGRKTATDEDFERIAGVVAARKAAEKPAAKRGKADPAQEPAGGAQ